MGLRSWAKKQARKAKKKAEEAKRKAQRAAHEAKERAEREARAAKRRAEEAARAAERKAEEAKRKAERAARDAQRAFEDALDETTDPMERLALKAERAIKEGLSEMDVRKMIRDELNDLRGDIKREVIDEIRDEVLKPIPGLVTNTLPDLVTEKLPEAIEKEIGEAFEKLAEAVTVEGLKAVRSVVKTTHSELEKLEKNKPDLVGAINELGGKLEIGPITLAYANFYTRTELVAGVLDQYVNHPPELRRGPIIDMVKALGPDTVDLGISIQVVALVVGSKELGVGGGLNDVSIDLFAEIGDVVLEKMGVPA